MSRQAIAAVLAREDLSCGERLVAFSLASFADRGNCARAGTPAAAGRAGLGKSRFLEARDGLVHRGLLVVERAATGRGRAGTLALPFADAGPWWEGDINAELFEAVLGYSRAQGPARLLLAAMAALADERGLIEGLTTEGLCAAAGIADRTYRRVRGPLLASGELVVRCATRGRGNTNSWEIPDRRSRGAAESRPRRRVAPPAGVRPLVATIPPPTDPDPTSSVPKPVELESASSQAVGENAGQDRTVSSENRPVLSGVSRAKGCQDRTVSAQNRPGLSGVSALNPCQDRTLSLENPAQNPAENPAQNPAPIARAGREPQNPRTPEDPPNPPEGGSRGDQVLVEETYVTERGRKRRRVVAVDLAAVRARLAAVGAADRGAWEQIRALLLQIGGESMFEIWLDGFELIAVEGNGSLVVSAPEARVGWVRSRFGRVLDDAAQRVGRGLRIAEEVERKAAESLMPMTAVPPGGAPDVSSAGAGSGGHLSSDACAAGELVDLSAGVPGDRSCAFRVDQSAGRPANVWAYRSAYPSSYADVYNHEKEVS